jgi:hypothetical protein
MGVVAKLLRLLPNPLFDRLMSGRPRKHRQAKKPIRERRQAPGVRRIKHNRCP